MEKFRTTAATVPGSRGALRATFPNACDFSPDLRAVRRLAAKKRSQDRHDSTRSGSRTRPPVRTVRSPGVPDAAEGPERHLFKDAGDSTQNWFLPAFRLADDIDAAFSFAASKRPADRHPVQQRPRLANPAEDRPGQYRGFSCRATQGRIEGNSSGGLEAAILVETVRNGHPVSTTCPATITPQANGSYALVTDAIIGVNILALFQTSRRPGLQDASSQRDFEPGASSQNRRSCRAVQHDGSPA
jgi:hypothetical protein